jgi:hypothetical protein
LPYIPEKTSEIEGVTRTRIHRGPRHPDGDAYISECGRPCPVGEFARAREMQELDATAHALKSWHA